jgi:hypothetical protein
MSILSITSSPPVTPPNPVTSQTSNAQPDSDANDDAGAAQPPAPAPLPPGQGTRIDQLA